jgi:hypothetical protein
MWFEPSLLFLFLMIILFLVDTVRLGRPLFGFTCPRCRNSKLVKEKSIWDTRSGFFEMYRCPKCDVGFRRKQGGWRLEEYQNNLGANGRPKVVRIHSVVLSELPPFQKQPWARTGDGNAVSTARHLHCIAYQYLYIYYRVMACTRKEACHGTGQACHRGTGWVRVAGCDIAVKFSSLFLLTQLSVSV